MVSADVLLHLGWELEVLIYVTGVGILGTRADRELLFLLPFQNPFASRWTVVLALDLEIQRAGFIIRNASVQLEHGDYLDQRGSVGLPSQRPGGHNADVLLGLKGINEMSHHAVLS
jgi:hypothetical protein